MKFDVNKFQACDQKSYMMEKTDKGNLCKVCNKHLVDFRNMNLKQIEKIHANSTDLICGTYDRSLFIIHRKSNLSFFTKLSNTYHKSILAASALVFFISNSFARADEKLKDSSNIEYVKTENEVLANKIRIFGKITERKSERSIEAVKIYIPALDLTTYSLENGEYEFNIDKNKLSSLNSLQLFASKRDFIEQIVNVLDFNNKNEINKDIQIDSNHYYFNYKKVCNSSTIDWNDYDDCSISGGFPFDKPVIPWYKKIYFEITDRITIFFDKFH